ncbi:MAG: VOC family protein, partial [Gemmatimonadetes bacterium]|nr:VOC family protein [Gemmatimonadota bacterium]
MPLEQLIPSLGVADIERSVDFYREYFGFDITHSHEERGSLVWCHMKSGGADLMLQQLADDQMERLQASGKRCWVMYVSLED